MCFKSHLAVASLWHILKRILDEVVSIVSIIGTVWSISRCSTLILEGIWLLAFRQIVWFKIIFLASVGSCDKTWNIDIHQIQRQKIGKAIACGSSYLTPNCLSILRSVWKLQFKIIILFGNTLHLGDILNINAKQMFTLHLILGPMPVILRQYYLKLNAPTAFQHKPLTETDDSPLGKCYLCLNPHTCCILHEIYTFVQSW